MKVIILFIQVLLSMEIKLTFSKNKMNNIENLKLFLSDGSFNHKGLNNLIAKLSLADLDNNYRKPCKVPVVVNQDNSFCLFFMTSEIINYKAFNENKKIPLNQQKSNMKISETLPQILSEIKNIVHQFKKSMDIIINSKIASNDTTIANLQQQQAVYERYYNIIYHNNTQLTTEIKDIFIDLMKLFSIGDQMLTLCAGDNSKPKCSFNMQNNLLVLIK